MVLLASLRSDEWTAWPEQVDGFIGLRTWGRIALSPLLPAEVISGPYHEALHLNVCDGCGICETRCQMEAIVLGDGQARLDSDHCIGCGQCVTTWPTRSLSLACKPAEQQR